MDDFYKRIKKNVESRPEPNFTEDAWTRMQARMEEVSNAPAMGKGGIDKKWLLLLALCLLGSVLLNSFFFFQGNKNVMLPAQANATLTDTVVETKVVYQTDTIYIKEIITEKSSNSNGLNPNNTYNKAVFTVMDFTEMAKFKKEDLNLLSTASITKSGAWDNYVSTELSNLAVPRSLILTPEERKEKLIENLQKDGLQIQGMELESVAQENWNTENPIQLGEPNFVIATLKRKKRMRDHLYYVRPKNLMVGMSSGFVYSASQTFNTKDGLILGADAEIVFSRKWRIFSEFNIVRSFYKSDQMGDEFGVPVIDSPNDEYEFAEARVSLQSLQYSVGFKRIFNYRKFKPYVALGITGVSIRPFEIVYEFEKNVEDLDLTVDSQVNRNDFLNNQLLLKAGLEYRLKKHWSLQVNGFYRYELRSESFSSPDLFGLRGGILYAF